MTAGKAMVTIYYSVWSLPRWSAMTCDLQELLTSKTVGRLTKQVIQLCVILSRAKLGIGYMSGFRTLCHWAHGINYSTGQRSTHANDNIYDICTFTAHSAKVRRASHRPQCQDDGFKPQIMHPGCIASCPWHLSALKPSMWKKPRQHLPSAARQLPCRSWERHPPWRHPPGWSGRSCCHLAPPLDPWSSCRRLHPPREPFVRWKRVKWEWEADRLGEDEGRGW